jgi:hypothetical protein
MKISCFVLAFSAVSCTANHRVAVEGETSDHKAVYELVTKAINREDWESLRGLAKRGMRGKTTMDSWRRFPVRVGKLMRVDDDFQLEGKQCTMYSFALQYKDGRQPPICSKS